MRPFDFRFYSRDQLRRAASVIRRAGLTELTAAYYGSPRMTKAEYG